MLKDAGLIIPIYHTDANGVPLGAEINERVVKYLIHDTGVLLGILGIDDDIDDSIKEMMVADSINLVDKGTCGRDDGGLGTYQIFFSAEAASVVLLAKHEQRYLCRG